MIKLSIKIFAFVMTATLLISSCSKKMDFTYDYGDFVEVAPRTTYANGGLLTNATTGSFYSKRVSTASQPTDSIPVNLVGALRATDTKVTYIVATSSTLTASEYTVTGTVGELVIPANSSRGYIIIKFKPVTATKSLVVTLTGGDNVKANPNYATFTYDVRP